jgi:hypothetical protein
MHQTRRRTYKTILHEAGGEMCAILKKNGGGIFFARNGHPSLWWAGRF